MSRLASPRAVWPGSAAAVASPRGACYVREAAIKRAQSITISRRHGSVPLVAREVRGSSRAESGFIVSAGGAAGTNERTNELGTNKRGAAGKEKEDGTISLLLLLLLFAWPRVSCGDDGLSRWLRFEWGLHEK